MTNDVHTSTTESKPLYADNDSLPPVSARPKRKMPNKHQWIIIAVVVGLNLLVLLWLSMQPKPAPQIAFNNVRGEMLKMSALKGKVVLVNFWATSCTTCVAEMPRVIETYQRHHAQGFETIAVAMSYDRPDFVMNFIKTRDLPFHVVLDLNGKIAENFNQVKATPTSFLIDKQGNIVKQWVGEPQWENLNNQIEGLLEKA
jgi:peroxiredoxin